MEIKFNFDKKINNIKPMHGVGQPPLIGISDRMFHYLTEAGIPYSRLHDVGGAYGSNMFVDIPNIFRNFDADDEKEENYDFAFTDKLIEGLYGAKCEPVFRLGVTIENNHRLSTQRIFPPSDFHKWARVCEKIIRHYNEGWANGYNFGIKYWEIWNEPDNAIKAEDNPMWKGTPLQFYNLYEITAKHLKNVFGNSIKIGGYGSCGFRYILSDPDKFNIDGSCAPDRPYGDDRSNYFITFFEGFFDHIKKTNTPIDFFTWHSYMSADRTVQAAKYLSERLCELGYKNLETHLNEWNNLGMDGVAPALVSEQAKKERPTPVAAAKFAAMMCSMQNTDTDILCFYDARVGISYYGGMFNPLTFEPFSAYYAFKGFNELYKLCNQAEVLGCGDGIYALAAYNGEKKAVLIASCREDEMEIKTNLTDDMNAFLIDDDSALEKRDIRGLCFKMKPGTVVLFKNYDEGE